MSFIDAAAEADVPSGAMFKVDVAGTPVVLVRTDAGVFALEDHCPHAGAPLSAGTFRDGKITCSWHGWRFVCATGACDLFAGAPPATTRAVRVENGRVLVAVAPGTGPAAT